MHQIDRKKFEKYRKNYAGDCRNNFIRHPPVDPFGRYPVGLISAGRLFKKEKK